MLSVLVVQFIPLDIDLGNGFSVFSSLHYFISAVFHFILGQNDDWFDNRVAAKASRKRFFFLQHSGNLRRCFPHSIGVTDDKGGPLVSESRE